MPYVHFVHAECIDIRHHTRCESFLRTTNVHTISSPSPILSLLAKTNAPCSTVSLLSWASCRKLEWLYYLMLKTAPSYVHSSGQTTRMWRTDRQTDGQISFSYHEVLKTQNGSRINSATKFLCEKSFGDTVVRHSLAYLLHENGWWGCALVSDNLSKSNPYHSKTSMFTQYSLVVCQP